MTNKAAQNTVLAFIMGVVLMIWAKAEWNTVAVLFLFVVSIIFGVFTSTMSEIQDK